MPDKSGAIAATFPMEERAFVIDMLSLRQRGTSYPFAEKSLDLTSRCVIAEVIETPERFWHHQATLRALHVHPLKTFTQFLLEAGWSEEQTPTYDQLRTALARAADENRRYRSSSSGIVVTDTY